MKKKPHKRPAPPPKPLVSPLMGFMIALAAFTAFVALAQHSLKVYPPVRKEAMNHGYTRKELKAYNHVFDVSLKESAAREKAGEMPPELVEKVKELYSDMPISAEVLLYSDNSPKGGV